MGKLLEPIVDGHIWVCQRPIKFVGVWLRTRSVVVRLGDGSLWIQSPPPPTDALVDELSALGTVKWLVVPNRFHHLATPAFARAFPDATVVGPASVVEKNDELSIDIDIVAPEATPPELEAHPLAGVPFIDETIFFHRPTRTLIGADMAMSASPSDHWSWRLVGRLFGLYGKFRVSPEVRLKAGKRQETAAALRAILDLPIERISVAHADLVTDDPTAQLARAWRFVLRAFEHRQLGS